MFRTKSNITGVNKSLHILHRIPSVISSSSSVSRLPGICRFLHHHHSQIACRDQHGLHEDTQTQRVRVSPSTAPFNRPPSAAAFMRKCRCECKQQKRRWTPSCTFSSHQSMPREKRTRDLESFEVQPTSDE